MIIQWFAFYVNTFMLKNKHINFTPVSNIFIEKYMPNSGISSVIVRPIEDSNTGITNILNKDYFFNPDTCELETNKWVRTKGITLWVENDGSINYSKTR